MVDVGILMAEVVLSTKFPEEQVETIRSIVEEKGITVSALLRELLDGEIKKKKVDWGASCFGFNRLWEGT